jgi:hypothetical protein
MTIEQTVEIPENHRLFFDISRNIPSACDREKAAAALEDDKRPNMLYWYPRTKYRK